jgi:PTS system nitrogen regulatory IIA component
VAVPHARLKGLDRMRGVFVRLEQPVDFDAVDDQPVDLIFALFAPKDATGVEHLRALARVSRLLRQSDLRQQLRQARTTDAIHALLVQDPVQASRSSAA